MASVYQTLDAATPYESFYRRFLAIPGLLLTTALVIALVVGERYQHTFPGHFYNFVVHNRSSTAFLVQILSHVLGALFVFALTTLVNFRTRLTITHQSVSLFRLSWWNSLCNQKLDHNLPVQYAAFLLLWWAALLAPSALWAGAITPVTTTTTQLSSMIVSKYTADPDQLAWNQTNLYFQFGAINTTIIPNKGSFSFYPAYPVGGLILDTATDTSANQTHAKHDRTRYSYSNRSYGVGSSIGLAGDVLNVNNVQRFNFSEVGYASQVKCAINATSDWQIYLEEQVGLSGIPNDYVALGSLPNSDYMAGENITNVDYGSLFFTEPFTWNPEGYPVLGFSSNTEIVALAGLSNNNRNIFAIAAYGAGGGQSLVDTRYGFLNNTQCEVIFTPHLFNLSVDTTQRIINVTKADILDAAAEALFDSSTTTYGAGLGVLAQRAMRQVMTLAMINISVYTSVIGDVLASSAQNQVEQYTSRASTDNDAGTEDASTAVALTGVAQALESMLDDMLSGFASAQLMLTSPSEYDTTAGRVSGGRVSTPAVATVGAVKFGTARYIYPLAALNFAIVLVVLVEGVVWCWWRDMYRFDYNDMASLVVATSLGGEALGSAVVARNRAEGRRWSARKGEGEVGRLRVKLVEDGERGMMVVMQESGVQGRESEIAPGPVGGIIGREDMGMGMGMGMRKSDAVTSDSVPLVKLNTVRRKPLRGDGFSRLDSWGE